MEPPVSSTHISSYQEKAHYFCHNSPRGHRELRCHKAFSRSTSPRVFNTYLWGRALKPAIFLRRMGNDGKSTPLGSFWHPRPQQTTSACLAVLPLTFNSASACRAAEPGSRSGLDIGRQSAPGVCLIAIWIRVSVGREKCPSVFPNCLGVIVLGGLSTVSSILPRLTQYVRILSRN